MNKKDTKGLIISYLDIFYDKNIKTGNLCLLGSEINLLQKTTDGKSIFIKNINGDSRRLDIDKILQSKEINFKALFKRHYNFFYESDKNNLGYNEIIDEILKDI